VWKRGGGFHSWRVSTPFIFYLCFQSYKITILTDLLLILFKLLYQKNKYLKCILNSCKITI
jgi:hypothetical protein